MKFNNVINAVYKRYVLISKCQENVNKCYIAANGSSRRQGVKDSFGKLKISLSRVFSVQHVGVTEIDNDIWLVSFMDNDLGFFDKAVDRVEFVGANPFTLQVLPMSPE
jgi:hypothetical protein